jgi:hypothetical protein
MPFIPVANTVMSEIRMRLDGQQIENTLYWQKGGSWSSGDILTLGNALLTWWPVNYAPFVSSAVTLSEIYLTDLTSDTSGVLSVPAPTPHPAGDRSAASLPNNVALTISFRSGLRGRSNRGRNYISGLSEDAVVLNTVDAGVITDIENGYNALFDVASDTSSAWVIVSRYSGVDEDGRPIPRVAGETADILSVLVVDATVDSQRRRLPGRGN